jgi:hypothetical protein
MGKTMAGQKTVDMLRGVESRERLRRIGARFHLFLLLCAGAYALLLCAARLLSLIPDVFTTLTLLAPPTLAIILALVFSRGITRAHSARLADAHSGSKDLFLTSVLIENSIGEYKPLVLAEAERRAPEVRPARVSPYRWAPRALALALAMGALAAGVQFLPRLDPFGKQEERRRLLARSRQLDDSRKATALRVEMLQKEPNDARLSKDTQAALDDLKKTLDLAKPEAREINRVTLNKHQKELADLWRKESEQKLKDAFDRAPAQQQFGALPPKAQEWKQELLKGEAGALKRELQELKELAQKVAEAPENADKEKLRDELRQRMKDVADFMAKDANHMPAAQGMNRALEQLAMGARKPMDAEAMQALKETLKLTELELAALAQNVRDLQALEEGLKAAQLAKRLNDGGQLGEGGAAGDKPGNLDAYAALYAKMLAEGKLAEEEGGEGGGMGGPGRGRGGNAPENEGATSDFKSEQSRSALQAGKILMEWKTKEAAEVGQAREVYLDRIEKVKQGANEAILKEQVPPGYHQAISQYFNQLPSDAPTPPGK